MAILEGATAILFHSAPADLASGAASLCIGIGLAPGISGGRLSIAKNMTDYQSCTDFVLAHADPIRRWAATNRVATDPSRPFEATTIIVEDASPDTCLALVFIAKLIAGETVDDVWIQAAREWETGRTTACPMRSWATHHNALVHAILDLGEPEASVARALRKGVAYLEALLRARADPTDLPASVSGSDGDALQREAVTRLEQERISYRNLSKHALRVQLAIPFAGSSRRRLVDAIFFAEQYLHGSVKSFARADTTSWTGTGYLFSGVYRPGAPIGNDMTFSVAPDAGLSLLPLWTALEELEDAIWAGARPRDAPRQGLAGYVESASSVQPSNDPWWDGGAAHDLVAAPGKFGTPTKLSWDRVLAEVWRCFAPGSDLSARRRGQAGAGMQILAEADIATLRESLQRDADLWIIDLERTSGPGDPPLLWCPTLERSLAALIDGKLPTLVDLPDPNGFDFMRIGTGAAVVGAQGVLLLGSEHDKRFPATALRDAANDVASTLATALALEQNLADARVAVRKAIPSGRGRDRRDALTRLYAIQLRAREAWPPPVPPGGGPVGLVREACERRWRASERFHQVLEEAKELEVMITSSTENRAGSLLQNLAIYGFPAALFGNILGAAFGPMTAENESAWNVALNAVYWFGGLTAVASLTLFLVNRINRAQWRRAMEEGGAG